MTVEIHEVSESTNRKIEVKDVSGNLADPDTMEISIWKPDGTKDIDEVIMTNDSTGIFHYWYMVSDQAGIHKILFTATTAGIITKERDEFTAVADNL